ncbi:MAG: hypothetical protein HXX14_19075 [Bacteroidetes bacterium]|nr:hypothetical protein [Bacteroidota bacterium]
MMAYNYLYHVFFESIDEGVGYYIGSFKDKYIAEEKGIHVEDLIYSSSEETEKKQELRVISRSWIKYKIFPETEFTSLIVSRGVISFSGFFTFYSIESDKPDFVYKYIEHRGTTQIDLFPKQPFENCVMFQHELKRQIAQKKLIRRHRVPESRNIIIINVKNFRLDEEDVIEDDFDRFWCQEIEVTKRFFDEMEYTDDISISINDEKIKKEIHNFDNYFRHDVVLKARCYDEVTNKLYFDLVNIQ